MAKNIQPEDSQDDAPLEYRAENAPPKSTDYKEMGWKGFEDDDDDDDGDEIAFGKKEPIPEDELDMTPMVDVTFLLLIFFMVTASFSLQKSIQQPKVESDEPSTEVQEREPDEDTITVLIDQNNTYYVTSRSDEEVECPSDREMRQRVRDAAESMGDSKLVIVAHVDSLHKKVVAAWDGGVVAGIEKITVETTEEEL